MSFNRSQQQPQRKSNSVPLGGEGKSTMSAVDNGTKTVLRGSFDAEAAIHFITEAAESAENAKPGRVILEVHGTGKEGDYLITVRPLMQQKGFGGNGNGRHSEQPAPKKRFNWDSGEQEEEPQQRPNTRSFQERYEEETEDQEPETQPSRTQATKPAAKKAPARRS